MEKTVRLLFKIILTSDAVKNNYFLESDDNKLCIVYSYGITMRISQLSIKVCDNDKQFACYSAEMFKK